MPLVTRVTFGPPLRCTAGDPSGWLDPDAITLCEPSNSSCEPRSLDGFAFDLGGATSESALVLEFSLPTIMLESSEGGLSSTSIIGGCFSSIPASSSFGEVLDQNGTSDKTGEKGVGKYLCRSTRNWVEASMVWGSCNLNVLNNREGFQ